MRESPIATLDEDQLERGEFIQRLGRALVTSDGAHASGVVVGITGEWGSGKSSILRMAEGHLEDRYSAIVIPFDPWIISGRDDLIERLLIQLAQKLGADDRVGDLGRKVLRYVDALKPAIGAVGSAFGVVGANALATMGTAAAKKLLPPPDLHERRESLKNALNDCEIPIVVLIDEIDRLEDSEIRAVAQFVRAVADFDRISYLLAYDHKRVAEALGGGSEDRGAAYLEKIVQYQIHLPILIRQQTRRLFDEFVVPHLPLGWENDNRASELMALLFPDTLATPRDIKRLGGMVQVQMAMLGEVDPVDLVGWCALQVKAPQAIEIISKEPPLVGGPYLGEVGSNWEQFVRGSPADLRSRFETLLAVPSPISALLDFLFPARLYSNATNGRHPDCLCFTRPLVHVLRHGLPSGQFSRPEIQTFLNAHSIQRRQILTQHIQDGLIQAFVMRLGQIYPEANEIDHTDLWRDIAAFLAAGADPWPTSLTPFHSQGRHFEDALIGSADRVRHLAPALRKVCLSLVRDRDLHMAHEMVNRQIWANGCFSCQRNDRYLAFLSEEETVTAARELGEFLASSVLTDVNIIGRLRSSIPLHNAVRAGCWGEEHRERLTRALERPEVLDALILVFFPPGIMTDWDSLQRIAEAPVFADRAKERRQASGLAPSLVASYDHFLEFGIRQA